MKKLILALLVSTAFIAPVKADDEAIAAASSMVATALIYVSECKVDDEASAKWALASITYMQAAGVTLDQPKFKAQVAIKMATYRHTAKITPHFCQQMAEAVKKGETE
jgi:hypothetical protein